MTDVEVKKMDRPMSRLREWFEPGDFFRFLDMRPFDDRLRVEEEMVDDKLVIRAEVPGVDPDKDVEITVDDDVLRIQVERHQEETKKTDSGFRSEFRYGSFQRALVLPRGSKAIDVKATYHDGILQVEVPSPTPAPPPEKVAVIRD
jgi:HSP20 family protein